MLVQSGCVQRVMGGVFLDANHVRAKLAVSRFVDTQVMQERLEDTRVSNCFQP